MQRQAGLVAQRLFCSPLLQNELGGSNKLIWNAALYSSRAAESAGQEVAGSAVSQAIPQYSVAAAAAMAAKQAKLVPNGSLKPAGMFSLSRTFATSAPAAAAAPAAEQAAAAKSSNSMLRTLAKAMGALAAALGLGMTTAHADAPHEWAYGFQDTATSTAQAMVDLHHDIQFFLLCILSLVFYMFIMFANRFHYSRVLKPEKLTHHTTMEVIWTIIPTLIVLMIAIPSLTLIYSMDQHTDRPGLTVKVIGRQWYWSYEMHDHLQHKLLDPERLVALAEKSALK